MQVNICKECRKYEKIMTPLIIDIENNIKICSHILSEYIIDESKRSEFHFETQNNSNNVVK